MLTGIAVGAFKDLNDAASHMVEISTTYEPRSEVHERYMEVYDRYKGLYRAIRPLVYTLGVKSPVDIILFVIV